MTHAEKFAPAPYDKDVLPHDREVKLDVTVGDLISLSSLLMLVRRGQIIRVKNPQGKLGSDRPAAALVLPSKNRMGKRVEAFRRQMLELRKTRFPGESPPARRIQRVGGGGAGGSSSY